MIRLTRTSVALLGVLLIAGCAENRRWENPSLPPKQWSKDVADCRSGVETAINREQNRQENYLGRGLDSGADPVARQMTLYDVQKRQDRLIAECLRARGYSKVEPSPTQ